MYIMDFNHEHLYLHSGTHFGLYHKYILFHVLAVAINSPHEVFVSLSGPCRMSQQAVQPRSAVADMLRKYRETGETSVAPMRGDRSD